MTFLGLPSAIILVLHDVSPTKNSIVDFFLACISGISPLLLVVYSFTKYLPSLSVTLIVIFLPDIGLFTIFRSEILIVDPSPL